MNLNSFKSESTSTAFEQFKALKEKAITELLTKEKELMASAEAKIQELQANLKKEIKVITEQLEELGHKRSTVTGSRKTRTTQPKISDEEIKSKLFTLMAGGRKVPTSVIFKKLNIARPRFSKFLVENQGFLVIEGKKKSTVYFLK